MHVGPSKNERHDASFSKVWFPFPNECFLLLGLNSWQNSLQWYTLSCFGRILWKMEMRRGKTCLTDTSGNGGIALSVGNRVWAERLPSDTSGDSNLYQITACAFSVGLQFAEVKCSLCNRNVLFDMGVGENCNKFCFVQPSRSHVRRPNGK